MVDNMEIYESMAIRILKLADDIASLNTIDFPTITDIAAPINLSTEHILHIFERIIWHFAWSGTMEGYEYWNRVYTSFPTGNDEISDVVRRLRRIAIRLDMRCTEY